MPAIAIWLLSRLPAPPVDLAAVEAARLHVPELPATVTEGPTRLPFGDLVKIALTADGQYQQPPAPLSVAALALVTINSPPQLLAVVELEGGPLAVLAQQLVHLTFTALLPREV
jgi:hypothetical protein